MKKTIYIDDIEVELESTALTPYLYKNIFGEDVIYKMGMMGKSMQKDTENGFPDIDIEFFCKLIWVMAKTAKKHKGEEIEELEDWISQFEMFSMYNAVGAVVELWGACNKTSSKPAKK